mmetsp:Transcript_5575/g.9146  ORF Transcript_5575/g.9146 Transcript_5575/m.9146 type:complete len:167 (+) Transcript_5575:94-594(+)
MPKFSEKANASTANPSLLDGREGEELKHITGRLMTTLSINAEKVEDYFNAFSIFPLDKKKCVTMNALKSFYERAGLDLSEEDCIDAMKAFTGNELTFTLDFETYVINMERWARKVVYGMLTFIFRFVLYYSSFSLVLRKSIRAGSCTPHMMCSQVMEMTTGSQRTA